MKKKKKKTHKHPEKRVQGKFLFQLGLILRYHWQNTDLPLFSFPLPACSGFWARWVSALPGRPLRSPERQRPQGWRQIPWASGFPHAPAWLGEGPGPRFAPVHEFASYHICPLSGQESHGHILIKSRKGHMEVSSSPITLFTGWEADSVRWVPSSRGRRYGRAPGHLLQSTAGLDRDVDRCESRTQPQNVNEAEGLGRETAKQVSQHICQADKGRVLRKDRCKYWWCYSRRDCKKGFLSGPIHHP